MGLTAIGNLTGITASSLIPKLRKSRTNLAQPFIRSSIPRTLILRERNGLLLPGLGVLNLRRHRHNLIIKPTRLLRNLCPSERLHRILILHLARDSEIVTDVLRCLAHGLQTVGGFLILEDFFVEGVDASAAEGHGLGADSDANFDCPRADLVGDVVDCFEARGAEAVDA